MFPPEAAPNLYRELVRIAGHPAWTPREQVLALASLLERLFFELTKQEQLAFSTLFARISYAGHLYNMQPPTLRRIHGFRKTAARVREGLAATEADTALGVQALAETILISCKSAIPPEVLAIFAPFQGRFAKGPDTEYWEYKARVRAVALRDDPEHNCLIVIDEENPEEAVRVQYGLADRNENFNPTIQVIRKVFGFPVTLNLLEVDIDRDGLYRPRVFVLEPDYLIDVSAISECFKDTGAEPYYHLVKKFLPYDSTDAILLGNIANYFLDRLLHEPTSDWQTLFRETFQLAPFAFAPMSDAAVRQLSGKAQKHFVNLKSMSTPGGALSQQGIEPDNSVLEPTFFSEQYGIQGRLDLFYQTEEKAAIVELKSGTPFKPNSYGIQRSHFTQTLLYDLLVRSVYGKQTDPAKYILYSGVDLNHLRFAPTVAPEQWEALQLRNQIVALERLLCEVKPGDERVPIFAKLRGALGSGFLQRDFGRFETVYAALDARERKYFNAFAGFIAREQWLAKVGVEEQENLHGHAALWRSSFADKQQAFSILNQLEIVENRADQSDPVIIFHKTAETNPLANFRVGDIAVLYPAADQTETVLDHQVIKCTITEMDKAMVKVQLRYRQFNLKPFETDSLWQLEPDMLETGFTNMYRGLFEWAEAKPAQRALLLTLEPPPKPEKPVDSDNILEKITRSNGYFLLWGPPGTGKTSVMLRDLADWVLRSTQDSVLFLAYTNRAVDEICEALDALDQPGRDNPYGPIRAQYLRIGSRFSTAERFRDQLLSTKIAGITTRAELKTVLESRRIFVSTVASFSQNDGLLRLKKFQRLVVDEASQLLEPQIIGLLSRFEHFILIGDHRQLPAVTAQAPELTHVHDADLQEIGLTDLRDSYFERLYRRCEAQGWDWAFARLSRQGRMHEDIMDFPNRMFYGGFLETLPESAGGLAQREPLQYNLPGTHPEFEDIFSKNRVVFLSTPPEHFIPGQKTSRTEAELAVQLVLFFKELYAFNNLAWRPAHTLGIITPWRAQIAQLRERLSAAGFDPDEITIDTVERYQGSARAIVIVSSCVHTVSQLGSLVSLSEEGVDRKLNVALTRARRHVILLGNADILRQDARYQEFIDCYGVELST